jgi:hypothetical protein
MRAPRRMFRGCLGACAAGGLLFAAGCGVRIDGDFEGVSFTPDGTVLAVADRHDLLVREGAVIAARKNSAAQRMHVLLTAAWLDASRDWRAMTADEQLELKRELATEDGLLLMNLPLPALEDRDPQKAEVRRGQSSGDFDVAVVQGMPDDEAVAEQGLGGRLTVTVEVDSLAVEPRGGSVGMKVEVKRDREAGQDGAVATGAVTLQFFAPLLNERLTEANLSVAAPVLFCMQERGPESSAGCRAKDAWPIVDETGLVP